MTLLTEPTRIVLAKGYDGFTDDADATAYLAAVQAADGQVLEPAVRLAVNSFIKGCKADGIWTAIKASCILAGARTLTGALIPLVGTAPTNVGPFVSGDYNRKTGLVGDGSTKYLNSNRNNNTDPQDNQHLALYASTTINSRWMGSNNDGIGSSILGTSLTTFAIRSRTPTGGAFDTGVLYSAGFAGKSRASSTTFTWRNGSNAGTATVTSATPVNSTIEIFRAGSSNTTARLAFYSIGESLNLALLDTRVTTLINAFAAAIP